MEQTRREFLESGLGTISVLSFSLVRIPGLGPSAQAAEGDTVAEIPVIWMATGACSGCSISLLNAASPTVRFLLIGNVLPGHRLSLAFHSTLMAAGGDMAMEALESIAEQHPANYVLVVDGATAAGDDGLYCSIGEINGQPITGYDHVRDLGRNAMAVIAVGACAAFGGIPAAGPNPTECLSVPGLFDREGITTPYIRIPGCPPHPDWIVGTIATLLLGGLDGLQLDEHQRPAPYFRQCIHDNCPYRGHFERGEFAERFGEHGCLLKLGCKGPITYADCPIRKFNNGTNWCCQAGHPCIGCCHPDFPFDQSLFAPVEPSQLSFPAVFATARGETNPNKDTYIALGLIGAGGFLAGAGVMAAANRLQGEKAAVAVTSEDDPSQETPDG